MGSLIAQVDQLLKANFEGAETVLEEEHSPFIVGGVLIWKGFEGVPQIKRQKQMMGLLREKLPQDGTARITFILTVSPEEWAGIQEDQSLQAA